MGQNGDLVSIIIPAYNVEEYISRCLDSLLKQTYSKIEIIIVDDGSTDRTGEICQNYSQADERIRYIRKENAGQGEARNLAIKVAKGEYVTFADSDDWCKDDYVEKMYQSMKTYDSDICVCDKYGVRLDEEGKIISQKKIEQWMQPNERISIEKNKNLIYQIKFSLWAKMFRRKLFIDNEILQPSHKFENNTVIPMLVSKAKYLSMVDEPLYYYWMNRSSSTINNITSYCDMVKCLRAVDEFFEKQGIRKEYEEALYGFAKWNILHTLNRIQSMNKEENKEIYNQICNDLDVFMRKAFPNKVDWLQKRITVWGSYNLVKTVRNIVPREKIKYTFSFSSIVSVAEDDGVTIQRKQHENAYRNNMIEQDLRRTFFENKSVLEQTDVLFIDLLEERFDICMAEGGFCTQSDILTEVIEENVTVLERNNKYWELWEQSCKRFIEKLLSKVLPKQIILVKYNLAKQYGSMGQKQYYPDVEKLDKMNKWLKKAYQIFEVNCPECTSIVVDEAFYFTEKEFEFGCYPYHLNYMVYEQVAQEIHRKVEEI